MGFSGGGSNTLKPHKHSSAVQDGSPLNMNNVTEAALTAGDIVYSDGAALQRLAIGADGLVLAVSGSTPSWSASTSNPLIKVTKTFADIAAGEIDIYTLPQDAALVNVYTDITSVFDLSTGVTIGDAGDDNGFQEATDWTAGTGLTDATRGAYVTSFKTMRSTSGSTAIKAYNFGSLDSVKFDAQGVSVDPGGAGDTLTAALTIGSNSNRLLVATAGSYNGSQTVTGITWTPPAGAPEALTGGTGNLASITGSDGQSQLFYLVNPTVGAGTITCTWAASTSVRRRVGGMSFYDVDQVSPIGVTTNGNGSGTTAGSSITPTTADSAIVDGLMWLSGSAATVQHTAGWSNMISGDRVQGSQYDLAPTINVPNTMYYTGGTNAGWAWVSAEIKPASLGGDTQGAVDFYLQVVD